MNEVKRITEELKARELELPLQIVISWILSSLGDEFEGFVSNITQSFRQDANTYDFDTLTSTILDEAKRHKYKNYTNTVKQQSSKGQKSFQNKSSRVNKKP